MQPTRILALTVVGACAAAAPAAIAIQDATRSLPNEERPLSDEHETERLLSVAELVDSDVRSDDVLEAQAYASVQHAVVDLGAGRLTVLVVDPRPNGDPQAARRLVDFEAATLTEADADQLVVYLARERFDAIPAVEGDLTRAIRHRHRAAGAGDAEPASGGGADEPGAGDRGQGRDAEHDPSRAPDQPDPDEPLVMTLERLMLTQVDTRAPGRDEGVELGRPSPGDDRALGMVNDVYVNGANGRVRWIELAVDGERRVPVPFEMLEANWTEPERAGEGLGLELSLDLDREALESAPALEEGEGRQRMSEQFAKRLHEFWGDDTRRERDGPRDRIDEREPQREQSDDDRRNG